MTITRRRRWVLAGGLLVGQLAVLVASCSQGLGESDCTLLATAIGKFEQDRCDGGDAGYLNGYMNTINYAANGNCANITSVRDHVELVDACIPCILDPDCYGADAAAAFCSELDGATLPEACDDQLQL